MPEIPFEAFEFRRLDSVGHQPRCSWLADSSPSASSKCEPVQKMLGLWIQVHLKIADNVAAVRQERDRLVHLHSLRFEHLEQAPFGLGIVDAAITQESERSA